MYKQRIIVKQNFFILSLNTLSLCSCCEWTLGTHHEWHGVNENMQGLRYSDIVFKIMYSFVRYSLCKNKANKQCGGKNKNKNRKTPSHIPIYSQTMFVIHWCLTRVMMKHKTWTFNRFDKIAVQQLSELQWMLQF